MSNNASTIFFAGGGTGGHIFPSLAIAERLAEKKARSRPHFLVSNRPLDAQVLTKANMPFTPLPAQPMSVRPWDWPGFYRGWTGSVGIVRRLIGEMNAAAVVTMGGFVSAPAVAAAKAAKIPVLLVNLDAVPGRANRLMGKAPTRFSRCIHSHCGTRPRRSVCRCAARLWLSKMGRPPRGGNSGSTPSARRCS